MRASVCPRPIEPSPDGVDLRPFACISLLSSIGPMATWDDVRRLALALPETSEVSRWGNLTWSVRDGRKDRGFVWERPLRKADLAALGPSAPEGPILAARLEHEGHKFALIEEEPSVYFTTPHFNG